MSADLNIHIFEGITERDLAIFCANTIGSKYFNPGKLGDKWDKVCEKIGSTDQINVGEVSWLKAALFDSDEFIPDPIGNICEIIGEDLPVIDDILIAKINVAMKLPNKTSYSLASGELIIKWLEARRGKRIFTVSW
jgi:hypothetical protein